MQIAYTGKMVGSPRSPLLHELFSAEGRLLKFKKDQAVFSTDGRPAAFFVLNGYIKRYLISDSGSLGVQIIYGPQDVFSLTKIYDFLLGQNIYDGPEVYYYKTMSAAQLLTLDRASLTAASEQNSEIYKELFGEAGHHLHTCVHRIENVSLANSYSRVAHELLFCARRFGIPTPTDVELLLPLTHQDIADLLGVTRETVSKAITRLRKKGVLSDTHHFTTRQLINLELAAYHGID